MDSLGLEDDGEPQPSLEASLASDVMYDDAPICPCIGSEHQAEIPNLLTVDERRRYMTSSLESMVAGYDYPVMIGLPIPIMWAPSEVHKEEESQAHHSLETEARISSRGEDSQVTSVYPTSNNVSDHDLTWHGPHSVVPVDQMEAGSNQAHHENFDSCSTQEGLNFTNKPMEQQREIDHFTPLPASSSCLWSGIEAECFLLGLYIFGKNLRLVSRFLGNNIGDGLSYYYGKFYKSDAYNRWSECRKARTRRCILGERIFTGWRQHEIISRLKSEVPKEAHDSLVEMFKSFSNEEISLEDFVFTLKSTAGTKAFIEVVGIGKGKHDLTGFVLDSSKPSQVLSVHPDMPTGKDCSSLASEDIIKFLTGDFRRSKTRSNDIFWEAVWPRLLARGWHSEQPNDVRSTKNCLVFLVPGIKKFSRSKLTKGTHYFDSVSDVLKRVAADPVLLELEVGGMDNDGTPEQNGYTDMKVNHDDPLDDYQEVPKFTIIDTTLVQGEEPFCVRELRKLPADANVRFVPSRHSHSTVIVSSSEEQDVDDRSSDDQEDRGQVTAPVNDIEIISASNPVDSFQNMLPASSSSFPVNGHSSNGSSNKTDLTYSFGTKTKTVRRKYLSPVSKRRRLSSCSNDQNSRRSFSFSKGDGLEKEKTKPLSTSLKPAIVDAGGNFQSKTIARCSTKEKPCEQIKIDASNSRTNDRSNGKINMTNLNENRSFECKVDVVPKVHPKFPFTEAKFAKEGEQVSSLAGQTKPVTPIDDKTSVSVCATSSEDHGSMKARNQRIMAVEAPSIPNSKCVRGVPEATGGPASAQPESQVNSRRHGTRNRSPTAKVLEALASGSSGGKRKGEPKSPGTSRPSQRARKSTKDSVCTPTSSDTDKSSMDADAQR